MKFWSELTSCGCKNQQSAATKFGYTQLTWDNKSGKEQQPPSAYKQTWSLLTDDEKAAAMVLGYTQTIWDDQSGEEINPASAGKYWSQLITCAPPATGYAAVDANFGEDQQDLTGEEEFIIGGVFAFAIVLVVVLVVTISIVAAQNNKADEYSEESHNANVLDKKTDDDLNAL